METFNFWKFSLHIHCVKSVRIRSFSGPYFASFELNTETYSECGKIRTRKGPNMAFFHAVIIYTFKLAWNYLAKF